MMKNDDHNFLTLAETLNALRDLQRYRELSALFDDFGFGDEIFDGAIDLTGEIA